MVVLNSARVGECQINDCGPPNRRAAVVFAVPYLPPAPRVLAEFRHFRLDREGPMSYSCSMVQMNKRQGAETQACCSGLQSLISPRLFKALSDPKRISLLIRMLEEREPCTVGRVAEGSGVDMSVVSRHLAILREAGIITCEKRGKEVWCAVQTGAIAKILRHLADAIDACCPDGCRIPEPCATPPPRAPRQSRT